MMMYRLKYRLFTFAAFLMVAGMIFHCGVVRPPNAAQLDVFECQLAALEAAVPREAAEDLVMAARAKNIEYVVRQLLALGLDGPTIEAVADAFSACSAPVALEPAEVDPSEAGVPPAGSLQIEAN